MTKSLWQKISRGGIDFGSINANAAMREFIKALETGVGTFGGGTDLYVDPSGSDEDGYGSQERPYATAAFAVSKASANDTIHLADGTYTGNITIAATLRLEGSAGVTLAGTITVTGAANLELVGLTVSGLITLSGTGTLSGEWLTATAGITATAGATVRLVDCTVDDVDLSGGVCAMFSTRTAFTGDVVYSGTGVGRLVDCHVAGDLTCDGVGAYLLMERTGVIGLTTVDGGAAMSFMYANDCPLGAFSAVGAGGFGAASLTGCRFSGAMLEDSGMIFVRDSFWTVAPVIETRLGGVVLASSLGMGLLFAGGSLTGTPFLVNGGSLELRDLEIMHTGDDDIFTLTAGEVSLKGCELEGDRATAMFTPTGGRFTAKNSTLNNDDAPDAIIADLALCADVELENVELNGVLDCSGLAIGATDVRYAHPGAAALIAAGVNARRRSHRVVGLLEAGRTLLAGLYPAGGPIDDAVGPWALAGGTMPFPATTISVLHSAGGGKAFTLYGTDAAGNAISESGVTGAGVPVYTVRAFATITRFVCEDPGGGTTVDLQTGDGVFVGWDILGVEKAAIEGELDTGTGAFHVETHVWAPTTLPAAALYQIEAAV